MAVQLKGFQKLAGAKQALIVVIVVGGLFATFWYYCLSPMADDIGAKTNTYESLKLQNAKSEAQKQQFAKLKAESEALQEELDRLKKDLPLERETHEILEDIQNKVSGSSLKIVRVGPRSTIDHEVYTEWPWEFEIVGNYHNIGAFLDKVRSLPRIVSVSNMKISSRASSGPEGQFSNVGATYTATTYVYRDEPSDPSTVTK
jgi:type IV pilus assembly protein PilO